MHTLIGHRYCEVPSALQLWRDPAHLTRARRSISEWIASPVIGHVGAHCRLDKVHSARKCIESVNCTFFHAQEIKFTKT